MSSEAKLFFDTWVARTFAADTPWVDLFPTPLAALMDLRAEATLNGIDENELRAAVGDLVAAVLAAMLDAPPPDISRFGETPDLGSAGTAAVCMELALSYADGLRDAIGNDRVLMANLTLHYLVRQGFALRPIGDRPFGSEPLAVSASSDPLPGWHPGMPQ